jgi:DNA-binding beta-propeller fold protein YncE
MWGSQGEGNGQFSGLNDIISTGQYIYVPDYENHRIQMFAAKGIDSSDNVYVTDAELLNIQKFDSDDQFLTKWGSEGEGDGQLKNPAGVALDSSDRVYVTDQDNGRIQVFIGNGTFIEKWGTTDEDKGQFLEPEGIDVDNSGHVYVADTGNNRVQVFVADTDSSSTPTVTSTAHTTKT